jgi:hypothetical protein
MPNEISAFRYLLLSDILMAMFILRLIEKSVHIEPGIQESILKGPYYGE